jgi:hypothetical protein
MVSPTTPNEANITKALDSSRSKRIFALSSAQYLARAALVYSFLLQMPDVVSNPTNHWPNWRATP